MSAIAEKRFAKKGAERLIRLPIEKLDEIQQLRSHYNKAKTNREKQEIIDAVAEILWPPNDGTQPVDPNHGIEPTARSRVDDYRARVGQAIKQRREQLEMTQQELATSAGLPQSHISRLEQGVHAPTHLTMKRIAKALKTTPSKLDPGFDS